MKQLRSIILSSENSKCVDVKFDLTDYEDELLKLDELISNSISKINTLKQKQIEEIETKLIGMNISAETPILSLKKTLNEILTMLYNEKQ